MTDFIGFCDHNLDKPFFRNNSFFYCSLELFTVAWFFHLIYSSFLSLWLLNLHDVFLIFIISATWLVDFQMALLLFVILSSFCLFKILFWGAEQYFGRMLFCFPESCPLQVEAWRVRFYWHLFLNGWHNSSRAYKWI